MNSWARRLSVWICAGSVLCCSTACRNTAAGFRRDAEDNGKKAAVEASAAADKASQAAVAATQSATEAAEAAAQTVNVKTALIADQRVTAKAIDVDTDRATRTVTLKGHVPSQAQKAIAEQIAIERSSGYRVRNELTISD